MDLAADIATVSAEVQVAAEDVKRTVDADEGWFNVLRDKVNETTQAVEDVDLTAKARKTAKGMFIARVQEVRVFSITSHNMLARTYDFSSLYEHIRIQKLS